METICCFLFGPLKPAYNRECELFMRIHLYETICTEDISSLLNTAYKQIAAIEKLCQSLLRQAFTL
jgi:hypothetical protein